ncbi:MAG: DNA primase, partial [Candidatus Methanomethylophilaceae archaeon]|nr:DNA primase [Candidatus Methanomethylophilaceae archaeon]
MNIDPNAMKYMVKAKITADGIVEKPDVVGAIFGQTEGLLGDGLDLRDLQKSGRIGRIEADVTSKGGKSEGILYMSSSLDQVETVIIASALETVDRVGPCKASIHVLGIEDVRISKREKIVERAKELLTDLIQQTKSTSYDLTDSVRQSVQVEEITTYGKDRCPAGPNVANSEAIIIVEGRSDVLNLLRAGIKNAIAVEGTNIPKTVQDLSKERVATAFVDGDRGGELILRELFQVADIDFVARAPRAHEVEELTAKQLVKCLRNKVPGDQYMEMNGLVTEERDPEEPAVESHQEERRERRDEERRERH